MTDFVSKFDVISGENFSRTFWFVVWLWFPCWSFIKTLWVEDENRPRLVVANNHLVKFTSFGWKLSSSMSETSDSSSLHHHDDEDIVRTTSTTVASLWTNQQSHRRLLQKYLSVSNFGIFWAFFALTITRWRLLSFRMIWKVSAMALRDTWNLLRPLFAVWMWRRISIHRPQIGWWVGPLDKYLQVWVAHLRRDHNRIKK